MVVIKMVVLHSSTTVVVSWYMEMPNVGYEVTKGVGKVVQELQEMLKLWSCWRR